MFEITTRPSRRLHRRPNDVIQTIVVVAGGITGVVVGYLVCVEFGLL